ncbi:hypothetical protein PI125_g20657 [Phytophthora idaei]|nr:hypothetical protein PI125_g20657 [Phytophthora idaei]KAG3145031.1 hypothetical protein PI126_g13896 [Phytophthora idaei]
MRQLKLDAFLVHDHDDRHRLNHCQDITTNSERSVLQACAEYEDVTQNVYVSRVRKNPLVMMLHILADWRLTCGTDCDNRATQTECVQGHYASQTNCGNQRIQHGDHAKLLLRHFAGKGVSLVAGAPITKDEFGIQYVDATGKTARLQDDAEGDLPLPDLFGVSSSFRWLELEDFAASTTLVLDIGFRDVHVKACTVYLAKYIYCAGLKVDICLSKGSLYRFAVPHRNCAM